MGKLSSSDQSRKRGICLRWLTLIAEYPVVNPHDQYPYTYTPLDYNHIPDLQTILYGPDPRWYMELFLTIPTQDGFKPFKLWPWMHQVVHDGLTDREIMLKARDTGSSTFWVALALREILTSPGANLLIAANKEKNAVNLLTYARVMVQNLPDQIRPVVGSDNQTEMTFPKLGNKITALVGSSDSGRAERGKILIATELAFWENANLYWSAVNGALVANAKVYAESTANTQIDKMHEMWMDKDNGYKKRFFGLWSNPTHDDIWYRQKRGDIKDRFEFIREYPESPQDAFTGSADTYFDPDLMLAMGKNVRDPIETRSFKGQGYVAIWKRPRAGAHYIISADVAGGSVDKSGRPDWSVAMVVDYKSLEHVASIHCRLDDSQFARALVELAHEYNEAFLGVEANNQGLAVLRAIELPPLQYPKIYMRSQEDDIIQGIKFTRQLPGWLTTQKNRPLMMMRLADAMRSGDWASPDEVFVDQAKTLDRSTLHAPGNGHDDAVYAAAIALIVRNAYNPMLWSGAKRQFVEVDSTAWGVRSTWTTDMPWSGGRK